MASGAPQLAPKDPSERRRRNMPARGEWIDIDATTIDEPVLPQKPPTPRPFVTWRATPLEVWKAWRNDPVTGHWSEADIEFAIRTLELYNFPGNGWIKNAAEIRQRETALALNPKGKRDLRFRTNFGPGVTATKDKPLPENVVPIDERRQQLSHGV